MADQVYHLGLDIGVASVGAAVISDDRIIDLFVRTFEKAETDKEGESLNKIRREARLNRRRIRRRAFRMTRTRRLFHRAGLIPSPKIEEIIIPNTSPWDLRAQALEQHLSPQAFAYALYHLIKHRGFQSNRKSEAQDEKMGQMLQSLQQNKALMQNKGYRTVGEMVAKDPTFTKAKRNKGGSYQHTLGREEIIQEVHTIFQAQRAFNNPLATPELETEVIQLLLARRPALSGNDLLKKVGKCTFEPNEYRAPKACFTVEKFIYLSKLNNLRIQYLGENRSLTDTERQQLLLTPFQTSKLTYKQLRKKLNLPDEATFSGLRYQAEKSPENQTFFEAKHYHTLRKAYEKAGLKSEWQRDAFNPEQLDTLAIGLTLYKTDEDIREFLQSKQIEEPIIEAVLPISFAEFIRLSLKALHQILPLMEAGCRYDEAISKVYGHHSQLNQNTLKGRHIPPLEDNAITNPVVRRAINQTRKLINAIVKKHGPPASVHIELARDLNKSFKERKQIEKRQKELAENREQDRARFKELFGTEPNGLDLLKLRLYREQNGQCAYTQQSIDLNRLTEPHYVEVDHALPYSRSFDNSLSNKVLVLKKANQDKGNRTPYEYLSETQWEQFEAWVRTTYQANRHKIQKLLTQNFDEEKAKTFRQRNLEDTRYAGRVVKNMIETHLALHPDSSAKRCVVVSGTLTSFLRGKWGLHKVRTDGDKHHALDAAVVAACTHSMVQRLAQYSKAQELKWAKQDFIDPETGEILDIDAFRQLEAHFPKPWPHFKKELEARLSDHPQEQLSQIPQLPYTPEEIEQIKPIRVSRMPTRRGLGAAHKETIRSAKYLDEQISTVKTPLTKIKLKDLPHIVGFEEDLEDPRNQALRQAIENRLKKFNNNPEKAFATPLYKPSKANGFNPEIAHLLGYEHHPAPEVRRLKLKTTQKSGLKVRQGIADNGDMIRIDLFTNGKHFFIIPLYVADSIKPQLPNKAAVSNKPESEWIEMDENYQFLYSFYPNDWIEVDLGKKGVKEGYYAGFDRSTTAINIWTHDRNQQIGKKGLIRSIGIKTAKSIKKYHIDILGNAYPVPLETRQPLPKAKS